MSTVDVVTMRADVARARKLLADGEEAMSELQMALLLARFEAVAERLADHVETLLAEVAP